MGMTGAEERARAFDGQGEAVNFLVDSGAGCPLLPHGVRQSLGLEPGRGDGCALAEVAGATRSLSYSDRVLLQGKGYAPVILGETRGDGGLAGAAMFENLGLTLNRFSRPLGPMQLPWRS